MTASENRVIVGITGASGALYARRVIQLLTNAGIEVHLAVTPAGRRLLHDELGLKTVDLDALSAGRGSQVVNYNENDIGATIASGSFLHRGMVIVPASSNSLGAIASGLGSTLVQRAAAVTLKERRRLIIAHRETPLSHIDIGNMQKLSASGAIICPLNPGYYLMPKTIDELIDFMAGKLLDLLGVGHELNTRWEERADASE